MDANLLEALDEVGKQGNGYKRPALNNVLIYGRVRCLINKPSFINEGIQETNGYFAIIDAYALKCLGEDYFRENSDYDVNSIYFTKGSILIYINDKSWVGKDVKVFGKSKSFGATIRKQKTSRNDDGISALMFNSPIKSKNGKSVFPLAQNVLVELNSFDKDTKGTVLEDFIVSLGKNSKIPYPETLDSIMQYVGVSDYTEINLDTIEESKQEREELRPPLEKEEGVSRTTYKQEMAEVPSVNTKPITNISSNERIDISKIDMGLTYHLEGQDISEYFEPFKDDIKRNAIARKDFKESILSEISDIYEDVDFMILRDFFIERIASIPQKKLGGHSSISCKTFIKSFIENCNDTSLEDKSGSLSEESMYKIRSGVEKLSKSVFMDSALLYGNTGDSEIDIIPMLKDSFSFVLNVIGTCTGIGYSTLSSNCKYCTNRLGMSKSLWMFMLLKYPYYLGLLGVKLSVSDCDLLYYSIGRVFDEDKKLYEENMNCRSYLIMLDTLNSCSDGRFRRIDKNGRGKNTFVKIEDYKDADFCYPSKLLNYIDSIKFVGRSDIKELLEILLGVDLTMSKDEIDFITRKRWYNDEYFNDLCEAGIVNTLENYCALEKNIEQEFLIYEVFQKMGNMPTGITDETIEEVISAFEKDRGFKLEGLQREGIKLCKYRAGVLSGCAGSGKTTTSDCMTEVLKTLNNDREDAIKIIYCTPTGKACRRLAEVVHSTVKTIHSQFNVIMGGSSYLQDAYKIKESSNGHNEKESAIYILDEMAMCSTELMYHIAKNVTENDMIYFLGDIKQLPPIGGGCPFKVLMQILPCVELGVSKRAAEGSLVNYNTSLINFLSDNYCKELLYDDKTFIARDCSDTDIALNVRKAFLEFIDGSMNGIKYQEDDIQVISGYQAKSKLSSTSRLNTPLQDVLRKNDRVLYYREVRDFKENNEPYYMNDRVIYINRNSYDICRYVYEDGIFHKVMTFGCVNGEMGKLVGIIRTSETVIDSDVENVWAGEGYYSNVSEEELDSIKERYNSRKNDLRDDDSFKNSDYYFVIIKVYDSDLRRDVMVLLRGKGIVKGMDLCLSGVDLNNLALAYALTCHKMQGSQSKVVIAVFESKGSPEFINRNMINTIITRSQGIVCCIGSVLGETSMLTRGRMVVSKTDCKDILSVLSGNTKWVEEG